MLKFIKNDTNKQFKNIKNEIDGLKQEKEDAHLTMQEQKRKLIYDKEEITITRMLNIETGRQMADLEKNTAELTKKRLTMKGQRAQATQDVYGLEKSIAVFNQTLEKLSEANETEKCYIVTLHKQIKELRTLLAEERSQHEQYRGMTMLQRKQMNGLEQKQNVRKESIGRVKSVMKERIEENIKQGAETINNLENTTKNLEARQAS